ncbi:MAG: TetR/AcrR family transcriptional regulator [Elusimicrobiota bacterium]|jgi:AcrR family transcriptional regulator
MSRPSRNTDRLLLDAGRKLLPQTGVSGLSLRQIAAQAKVNLGMFHYHFGSKQKFARQVLQDLYEEFFRGFSLETHKAAPPEQRLIAALTILARFVRDNRKLILALLQDALNHEPEVIAFAKANAPRHIRIIAGLVRECQKTGALKELPLPTILPYIAAGVIAPNLGVAFLERAAAGSAAGIPLALIRPAVISDQAIAQRIAAALKGLRREP